MRALNFRRILLFFLVNVMFIAYGGWVYSRLPSGYVAFEGEDCIRSAQAQAGNFFKISENVKAKAVGVEATQLSLNSSVHAQAKLLGLIPFKEVTIDVLPAQMVVPCGNVVGVKLFTDGLLVLDVAKFDTGKGSSSPAGDAGIKAGDVLLAADGQRLESIEQMTDIVNKIMEKPLKLTVLRDGKEFELSITPRQKSDDGTYRIGAWVRDSTAGIGTLTFYRPQDNTFAALGHGIMDADIGKVYKISSGSIQAASIAGISRGARGSPGELKGIFIEDTAGMGTITSNTSEGIYGKINLPQLLPKAPSILAASRAQVSEGAASILCTIQGNMVDEYTARILKVMPSSGSSSKGMIIQITDKRLLDKTGGIVQGMSGSPIIQGGRLVGAVTHVFINDPTRGYGIFIDNMLKHG